MSEPERVAPVPVTDLSGEDLIDMVFDLWATGVQDTMGIAEATGLPEHKVYALLSELREAGR